MGAMKEHLFQLEEAKFGINEDDLSNLAKLLGGEIEGKYIRFPSPGLPPDDRSCFVRIDGRNRFFIYACEGPEGRAYAYVRRRLDLLPPGPVADKSARIRAILSETVPANGTPAEMYLRSRALTLPPPPCLRFHKLLRHWTMDGGESYWPAMVENALTPMAGWSQSTGPT